MANSRNLGGVIHTYQKYNPQQFPSPTQPPPDVVSPALEHLLMYGSMRHLSEEELARAVHLDPSQIAGLGPSLDALLAMLLERKRKILQRYETETVQVLAQRNYQSRGHGIQPPKRLRRDFDQAFTGQQIYDLERLWYAAGDDQSVFARQMVPLIQRLGEKYQVDELAAKYHFTGTEPLTVPEALKIKEELEKIDELLKQLERARETAQIALIDMEALSEFAGAQDIENLDAMRQKVEDYLRDLAQQQGLEHDGRSFQLTPKAYRLFQGRLLERIFGQLESSRTGRHQGPIVGEGAVEMQKTKPYEFGDSLTHMDIPQTLINAMIRDPAAEHARPAGTCRPIRLKTEDIEIHRTRNTPKCATVVIMDMSGSMRYEGQYIDVKRMALALDGLIRKEYPGDYLEFVEMYSFAKRRRAVEISQLLPKPVTVHDPVVRLRADMSREDISEMDVPPHFTNIQHGLRLARQLLAGQNTPNRNILLITDGLPTAHWEDSQLYLLYPPDPRTEQATLREGLLASRDGITINLFIIPSWSQSEDDIRFAYRLAESTSGRVFFSAGNDLDRCVVWDYVARKREVLA